MVGTVCDAACQVLDIDLVVLALTQQPTPPDGLQLTQPDVDAGRAPRPLGGSGSWLLLPLRDAGSTFGTLTLHWWSRSEWSGPPQAGAQLVADLLASYLAAAATPPRDGTLRDRHSPAVLLLVHPASHAQ